MAEGGLHLRIKKVKPAIYDIGAEPVFFPFKWGWVLLAELSEITGLASTELVTEFVELGSWPGRKLHGLHLACTRDGQGDERYFWFGPVTKERLDQPRGEVSTLEYLATQRTFVPAGWALAVIEEVKKRRQEAEAARA